MHNPPTILPLIRQHAADAAFYWQLIADSQFSPLIDNQKLAEFTILLDAHLDGLRAAGETGWQEALDNLASWQTAGEAFVATLLAFESGQVEWIKATLELLGDEPQTTSAGLVAALSRLPLEDINHYVQHWLHCAEPQENAWALAILGRHQQQIATQQLDILLNTEDEQLQAALCDYVGQLRLTKYNDYLLSGLESLSSEVRYQAINALVLCQPNWAQLAHHCYQLLNDYLMDEASTDLDSQQWRQRVEQLTRLYGHLLSYGDVELLTHLHSLPEHLQILVLAHHGDTSYLPILIDYIAQEPLAPLAFWAVTILTGIDIDDDHFLWLEEESEDEWDPATEQMEEESEESEINSLLSDLTSGLLPPNKQAVADSIARQSYPEQRLLLGRPVTAEYCQQLFADEDTRLVVRTVCEWHLLQLDAQ